MYMVEIAGLIKAAILENKCERSHEFFVLGGGLPGKVYMGSGSLPGNPFHLATATGEPFLFLSAVRRFDLFDSSNIF